MTISSNTPRVTLNMNGATTDVPFPYPVLAQADIQVIETILTTGAQTTKAYTTDYTFVETPDSSGAYIGGVTVRANVAPAATVSWTILNDPAQTQLVDLVDNGALPVDTQVERPLDRLTLMLQRVRDLVNRGLRQPDGDPVQIGLLPAVSQRLSKYMGFDGAGDPTVLAAPTGTSITTAFTQTLLDDADAATARTTLGAASSASLTTDEAILTSLKQAVQNPIINGNMEIWQRGTTFNIPVGPTDVWSADRWRLSTTTVTGTSTIRRSTNVPSFASAGVLFNYSLEVDVTVADASLGAGESVYLQHFIEGYNWRHFAQRQITLSFWVSSTKPGTHCVSIYNSGLDRWHIAEYTIAVADTWEYKTITFQASPSAGTWNYAEALGLSISFAIGIGANSQGIGGSWQTGAPTKLATANQVNVLDNAANFFRLTGVKLELGSVATPIQFRSFQDELALCKRYYQKSFSYATAPAQNAGLGTGEYRWLATVAGAVATMGPTWGLPVEVRPSFTNLWFNPSAANAQVRNLTDAVDMTATATRTVSDKSLQLQFTGAAGNAVGEELAIHWTVDAEL